MPPFLQPYRRQMPTRSSWRQIADSGWALAAGKSVHGFLILGSQDIHRRNLFFHETQPILHGILFWPAHFLSVQFQSPAPGEPGLCESGLAWFPFARVESLCRKGDGIKSRPVGIGQAIIGEINARGLHSSQQTVDVH